MPERDDTFKPVLEPHVAVYTEESLKNLADKLGLGIVHLTGYGTKRSELISRTKKKSLFKKILGRVSRLLVGAGKPAGGNERFYREYKFNEEGPGRWWVRVILKKK